MSGEFQKRLYDMEVVPPHQVWERLADCLDEINADSVIANKLQFAESIPPTIVWEKIKDSFYTADSPGSEKKSMVINFKKIAVAAIVIGIIVSAWFLFFKPGQKNIDLVRTETPVVQEKINSPETKESLLKPTDAEIKNTELNSPLITENKKSRDRRFKNFILTSIVQAKHKESPVAIADKDVASIRDEKPGDKTFDQPIDDLSMIASNDRYMTMVNANGRMVKIPVHLAQLAPRLQDKPITEDYYEIMFGEGAFWKDKLSDWRLKLATSPVSSGDLFSNMMDLLKSVQTTPSR